MIRVLATNITSPLGITTEQNYQAVKSGKSSLTIYQRWQGIEEPFAASLFSVQQVKEMAVVGYSRFESMVIHSVKEALGKCQIDLQRTIFILSTTKANIEELEAEIADKDYAHPAETARRVALYFGIQTTPVVVCNACISGVSAQLMAQQLIESGWYDFAVVCGADCVTPFTVAGFQSFKALSPFVCRPFDIDRMGLNLGEAAATIVFSRVGDSHPQGWMLQRGSQTNDAYHVSAPSPSGDGMCRSILNTLSGLDPAQLATVCVHGTATMFNDQMESKALEQTGLAEVPVSALKGYFGHTLGAAGVLETILTMCSVDEGLVLSVRGYAERGVSGKIDISSSIRPTHQQSFLKIISGFGGCNAALLYQKGIGIPYQKATPKFSALRHCVSINMGQVCVDEQILSTAEVGPDLLTEVYKKYVGNYPKYYKMDKLCRLTFVAMELLLQQVHEETKGENWTILLFNRTSSICSDRKHLATLKQGELSSPSVFLYTLPNIVAGEVAIRHGIKGETSFCILDQRDKTMMHRLTESLLNHTSVKKLLTGWVDYASDNGFEAELQYWS